jgi:D-beta-D-heptose 7-phosphate kinase/D-beta-D-heptose 1-phosphate adenosyltransferase
LKRAGFDPPTDDAKMRFVSEHFSPMLRADWELAAPAAADIEQKLVDAILPLLARRYRAAVRLTRAC